MNWSLVCLRISCSINAYLLYIVRLELVLVYHLHHAKAVVVRRLAQVDLPESPEADLSLRDKFVQLEPCLLMLFLLRNQRGRFISFIVTVLRASRRFDLLGVELLDPLAVPAEFLAVLANRLLLKKHKRASVLHLF